MNGRERDLNLLVGAVGLSALGDFLALIPLALHLQETTESGVVVALLFIAVWSPAIILAGPAGLLADRVSPRRVLFAGSLVQAALAVALAFTSGTVAVLVLAALLGSAFALAQPAEFALIPGVAGKARLAVANGRVETARYIGFTVGPFAGGVLAATGGMRLAMLVNAATFLVVAGVAAVVRPSRRDTEADAAEPIGRARDGLVFLLREPTLAVVMTVAFVSLLFMSATVTAEVFFAKDVLEVGDVGYGALIGTWTLGMALGASAIAPRVAAGLLASGALVAIGVQGLGIALPTLWLVPAFAFGWFLVGGLAHGTKNVLVRTLMHELVPAKLHGRAFAAYNGLRNAAELVAMLAGGLLVAAMGARVTLLLAGTIPVLAAIAAFVVWADRLGSRETPEAAEAVAP